MKRIFISHNHRDSASINLLKSINSNPNNGLLFKDKSLSAPVYNDYNHINRRPPSDSASKPVKKEISALLDKSDKLLVLIGPDTHSSLWVQWEINAFISKHGSNHILLMRIPNDSNSGAPTNAKHLPINNWDITLLNNWAK